MSECSLLFRFIYLVSNNKLRNTYEESYNEDA